MQPVLSFTEHVLSGKEYDTVSEGSYTALAQTPKSCGFIPISGYKTELLGLKQQYSGQGASLHTADLDLIPSTYDGGPPPDMIPGREVKSKL